MRKRLSYLCARLGMWCFSLSEWLDPISTPAQAQLTQTLQIEMACTQLLLQQQGRAMRLH